MSLNVFFWLVVLALLWGPSFLFIKVAVHEVPPLTLAAVRVGVAAVLLYAVLRIQGRKLPKFGSIWKHFAVMGLVSNALPFVLFSWGEQYIDSALAAILNGATPLFTILLAHFFTSDEDLTPSKGVGVLLGFVGLVVLMVPELAGGMQATSWGLLAMVVAAFSYGVAIVYARRNLRGLPPLVAPAAQLSMALPSWAAIGSLFTLAAFGTALAFVIYYRIMEQASATSLSMVTYMVPIVGTVLGVVVLNEQLGWTVYAGCALILLGVMIVNGVFRLVGRQRLTNVGARP